MSREVLNVQQKKQLPVFSFIKILALHNIQSYMNYFNNKVNIPYALFSTMPTKSLLLKLIILFFIKMTYQMSYNASYLVFIRGHFPEIRAART
jgi:hypothetical protein